MKIRITKQGLLKFWRGNKWKDQDCPLGQNDLTGANNCGDWCPMFQEPRFKSSMVYLQLCRANVSADIADFEDLR